MMEDDKKTEQKTEVQNTSSLIEQALRAAERLEAANSKQEELLKKQELLQARSMLGGRSEAGIVVEKKEETPAEYTKRIMSGKL